MGITKHQPGMFSWADLTTPDLEGSKKFYTELLGLDFVGVPMGEYGVYVMLNKGGKNVCAMFQMDDSMKVQTGGHPFWQSYFTVDDADESTAKARDLGGNVLMGPFDVFDAGRMSVIQDPTGAVFSIWQPKDHVGADLFGEPGALAWNELYTTDTDVAAGFYGGLFGWSAQKGPAPDGGEYFEYRLGDRSACGMLEIKKEWGEVPPNWSIYFAVADLDSTVKNAKDMGASEVMPPMEVEDVGRFCLMRDPQNAYVSFIQINPKFIQ